MPIQINPRSQVTGPYAAAARIPVEWTVDRLDVWSASYVDGIGGGITKGTIAFRQNGASRSLVAAPIALAAVSIGVAEGARAPAPRGINTAVSAIAKNSSLSDPSLPGVALGCCFPNPLKRRSLNAGDFVGTCIAVSGSADFGPAGAQLYLLFFGIPAVASSPRTHLVDIVSSDPSIWLMWQLARSNGFALIDAAGLSLSISAGLSASLMIGAIGHSATACMS